MFKKIAADALGLSDIGKLSNLRIMTKQILMTMSCMKTMKKFIS